MKRTLTTLLLLTVLGYISCTKTSTTQNTITSSLPIVTTNQVSAISYDTAIGGGRVISDGGLPVTERGLVWGTDSLPTIALSTKMSAGIDTGNFVVRITGLSCSTKFYVRAYATTAAGTAYGNQIIFTTATPPGLQQLNVYKSHSFDSVILRSAFLLYPTDYTFTNNLTLPAGVFLYVQFDSVYCNLYASNASRSILVSNGDTLQLNNSFGVHHNRDDISSGIFLGLYSIHLSGRATSAENNYNCKFSYIYHNMPSIRNVSTSFENDPTCNPYCPLQ